MDHNNSTDDRLLIPFAESARRIGIKRQTAYNWLSLGRYPLPVHRINRKLVVRTCDLEQFVSSLGGDPEPVADKPPAGHQHRRGRPRLGRQEVQS